MLLFSYYLAEIVLLKKQEFSLGSGEAGGFEA